MFVTIILYYMHIEIPVSYCFTPASMYIMFKSLLLFIELTLQFPRTVAVLPRDKSSNVKHVSVMLR